MRKKDILHILEERSYSVSGSLNTAVNVNNSGTLNKEKLEKERLGYWKTLTSWLAPVLIKKVQDYPYQDISNVEFSADFVVMRREDFDEIKEYVNEIVDVKQLMVNE